MSLIKKITGKNKNNTKSKADDTNIHQGQFKNIRIFSPDIEMKSGDETEFAAQVLNNSNKPISNEKVIIEVDSEKYEIITDDNGYAKLSADLHEGTYDIKTQYPINNDYAPITISKLTVLNSDQNFSTCEENTRLYAPDMVIFSKDEPNYTLRLCDENNKPISGEKLKIEIENQSYEEITDSEGFVSLDLNLTPKTYTVKTVFEGSENYSPISKNSEIKVKIREEDKEVMIEVNHVAMEFKRSKDKIDTLKEYVIRTIKRNKIEDKKIRILDDISFKIHRGERVGILGFNGAGKSTLLRIIAGIYEPTEGEIKINGKIAPLLELSAGFDKNYTGKNNIFLNGALLSIDEEFLKNKYDEIVEFSELGEHINYPVKNYSSGMRAKLGFSIATLINPEILIIDEILAVGDIKFRKKSSEKIKSLMQEGVTVLLVSHSINQIRNICDRCIWIENGRVHMEGECKEVCDAYVEHAKK